MASRSSASGPWVYSRRLHSYLEELYVVPDLRGNGLGRALLEAAMETARAEGAEHMELGTSEDDTAARGLYESAGFTNREGTPTAQRCSSMSASSDDSGQSALGGSGPSP